MTQKLYEQDAYQKTAEANILETIEQDGKILLLLDRTIFYPEGGGQPSDRGTIDGILVLDVQEKDGLIYHEVEKKPANPRVRLAIDWQRRFDFMQQHSGEHILSGIIHKEYQASNKGFHLGDEIVTIDIDIKNMTKDQLDHIETLANQAILDNKAVSQEITDCQGLAQSGARKQIQTNQAIRLVTIEDTDICPCCGTHVKSSCEIGLIKILKSEAHKGMSRISFLCGQRAFKDYRAKHEIIQELKQELNSDEESLAERTKKINEELQSLKYQIREQKNQIAEIEAEKLEGEAVYRIYKNLDGDQIEHIVKQKQGEIQTLVLGSEPDKKLIAYSQHQDMGQIFKDKLREYHGKGGGRGSLAQAKFDSIDDLARFMEHLK